MFNVFISELAEGWSWGFGCLFPFLRFGSWAGGSFCACADKSGLQRAVEGCSRGQPCHRQLLSAACLVPRALPCRWDLGSCTGITVAEEQPGDRGSGLTPSPPQPSPAGSAGPVALASASGTQQSPLSPLGTEEPHERQVRARMQLPRKSPGVVVMKITQQCALASPVLEKTFQTWIESCKGPPRSFTLSSEELECRTFIGRLRLLALLSLQRDASGRT